MKPIAAGVLCAALACCAALGGEQTYTDKKNGFEISLLEGWFTLPSQQKTPSIYYAYRAQNTESTAYAIVTVDALKEGAGLRSFFENGSNKSKLSSYALLDIQKCTVGGASALKLEVTGAQPSAAPLDSRGTIYYVVSGGRGYSIWFFARKSEFDNVAKDFDAIVKSFKLLKTE
jgi:hypothetical protein